MNAHEFVKQHGVDEAKNRVENSMVDMWFLGWGFHTSELWRVVESHELIQSQGGIDMVKLYLGNKSVMCWDAQDLRLHQAIADFEACQ